ncbi:flagellar motor protein MotD [Cellvibrio sp. KY-GH-1]|uniref:flagellar motor protein MotD n=1 Tax=Cellvibrio sp. KY-GH-1 TaxID=2303332 RepID=UPI001247DD1F|nr:flagellar motor protein MotD [Cellvibrio sp. KY-GH-1]QEY15190.1 flagellar motor protein MotD [Cellvibrio sp. KY-GH-1]
MVRRRREDIHINHERWLVSYADFITLLFAFFVVMYSISQVNDSKYRVLSDTFIEAFNQPTDSQTNAEPSEQLNPSNDVITPIDMGKTAQTTPEQQEAPSVISNVGEVANAISSVATAVDPSTKSDELSQISDLVTEKFSQLIDDQMVQVSSNELWLQIELKDSILFSSGSAETSEQAQKIFDEIAAILKGYSNPVQVEGFTDNIPINSAKYPTNWELSSARASAIVKYLTTKGVAPERLSAVGYGEYQPVASNETDVGRAQNRRVAIMVAKRKMDRPKANLKPSPDNIVR